MGDEKKNKYQQSFFSSDTEQVCVCESTQVRDCGDGMKLL